MLIELHGLALDFCKAKCVDKPIPGSAGMLMPKVSKRPLAPALFPIAR